jgi:hypothetical protein
VLNQVIAMRTILLIALGSFLLTNIALAGNAPALPSAKVVVPLLRQFSPKDVSMQSVSEQLNKILGDDYLETGRGPNGSVVTRFYNLDDSVIHVTFLNDKLVRITRDESAQVIEVLYSGIDDIQSKLIGDRFNVADVIKTSDEVAIGQFQSLGDGNADDLGASYSNAIITITQSLKGSLAGEIKVFYGIYSTVNAAEREEHPFRNVEYVIFIKGVDPKGYTLIKLLHATNENIAKVKALIAAKPEST